MAQPPPHRIHSAEAWRRRLGVAIEEAADRSIVFVAGAGLSVDRTGGVWNVRTMLEVLEREYQLREPGVPDAEAYRLCMGRLKSDVGLSAISALVRRAVLEACQVPSDDPCKRAVFDSADPAEACARLMSMTQDWYLPAGVRALAEVVREIVETRRRAAEPRSKPALLITTNFDPLLEIALDREGIESSPYSVVGDTAPGSARRDVEVWHVHGSWTDLTLHTAESLATNRERLKSRLRQRLNGAVIVVIGYGAWRDVIFSTLREVLAHGDLERWPEVIWAFNESEDSLVRVQYAHVFEAFAGPQAMEVVTFYKGIDAHRDLPEVAALQPRDGSRSGGEPSPTRGAQAAHCEPSTSARKLERAARRGRGPRSVSVPPSTLSRPIPATSAQSPYVGLEAFEARQASLFFGREGVCQDLVARVQTHPVVAVYGASGSGKSSVVAAGLIPVLREDPAWDVLVVRPGTHPFESLAIAIKTLPGHCSAPKNHRANEIAALAAELETERGSVALQSSLALRLTLLRQKLGRGDEWQPNLLVFVDQWEDLYTAGGDDTNAKGFIRLLAAATKRANLQDQRARGGTLSLVATVRRDYHERFIREFEGHVPAHDLHLLPMDREGLLDAIRRPAQSRGFAFEPANLPEEIANEFGSNEALLPLLQYALQMLWARRDQARRRLTATAYNDIGRLRGALTKNAEAHYEALTEAEQRSVRSLFLRFVIPNPGGFDTCAPVLIPVDEVRGAGFGAFQKAGLLVIKDNGLVEVGHEALIRHWERCKEWISKNRDALIALHRIKPHSLDWKRDKDPATLLTGPLLDTALGLTKRYPEVPVDPEVMAYVETSGSQRTRARWWRRGLGAFFIAAAVVSLWLVTQFQLTRTKLEARTNELLKVLAHGIAWQAGREIDNQRAALLRMSEDPRYLALVRPPETTATIVLEAATDDRGAEQVDRESRALKVAVEKEGAPTFYSVLVVDGDACPLAIWSSFKRATYPAFPEGRTRDEVRGQCRADAESCFENRAACGLRNNWWYHYFPFREYFVGAKAQWSSRYVVSRTFSSEDDGALKYAISVPLLDSAGFRGAIVGTAPPSLENWAKDPNIVVGLLGFRGPERCDAISNRDPDRRPEVLLLGRSDKPTNVGPREARATGTGGDLVRLSDYCKEVPPPPLVNDPLPVALNAWGRKAELLEAAWTHGACGITPDASDFAFSWQEGGAEYLGQLWPVGCAGLLAFAARRESTPP